ncbi:MAG: Nif3-like dinuclear metal center hexameric protein [Dysgonamonadaceae bacterium]|jgi:dinuclear metal center YbgI/SA1388 family protein|nr:Nif3-like dinuclear metal center hexameric protein [Dysgonamonadaceae bacterium]
MKVKDVINAIEAYAPPSLQESYDNSGIQLGDVNQPVHGLLLCLDVTEEVVDEAIERRCNLIVSHHPLIFKGIRSLTGANYIQRAIVKACKHDIAIYAAHTNMDNANGGVSHRIASKLGLQNIKILSPQQHALQKLVTFVPVAQAGQLRQALFNAGAGQIGNYDSCSYNIAGEGTFRAGENTRPFCGKTGELHTEAEIRIETILPAYRKNAVLRALLLTHPYEEPAYDLYPLENTWNQAGSGVIGELPVEEEETLFLQRLRDIFQLPCIRYSSLRNKQVKTIAVCGGSGAFLIPDAITSGAEVFITGEAKYNDFYDSGEKILLAVIGHYESEICTKEIFFEIITKKMPNFAVHFSNANTNPINYLK